MWLKTDFKDFVGNENTQLYSLESVFEFLAALLPNPNDVGLVLGVAYFHIFEYSSPNRCFNSLSVEILHAVDDCNITSVIDCARPLQFADLTLSSVSLDQFQFLDKLALVVLDFNDGGLGIGDKHHEPLVRTEANLANLHGQERIIFSEITCLADGIHRSFVVVDRAGFILLG